MWIKICNWDNGLEPFGLVSQWCLGFYFLNHHHYEAVNGNHCIAVIFFQIIVHL